MVRKKSRTEEAGFETEEEASGERRKRKGVRLEDFRCIDTHTSSLCYRLLGK